MVMEHVPKRYSPWAWAPWAAWVARAVLVIVLVVVQQKQQAQAQAQGVMRSDAAGDRAECSEQLVGLATCLSYVQGGAKTPSPECCGGLKQALAKSPKCLCVLVKDRDDPSLGLNINVTLALSLPNVCGAPANVSDCPKLLNLPPNSTDAQIFKQTGSAAPQGKGTSTSSGSGESGNAHASSSSGMSHDNWVGRSGWLGAQMMVGLFCCCFWVLSLLLLLPF